MEVLIMEIDKCNTKRSIPDELYRVAQLINSVLLTTQNKFKEWFLIDFSTFRFDPY